MRPPPLQAVRAALMAAAALAAAWLALTRDNPTTSHFTRTVELAGGFPADVLPAAAEDARPIDDPLGATTPLSGAFPVRYMPDPPAGPAVSAQAAILVETSTGTVLYAKNEHQRRSPASTTKMVTALIALESGRLAERVTVSRRAAGTPGSSASLSPGEEFTLEELLHGLMLPSGNDAAVAIAEHLAGSVQAFAAWMNRRARELGAYDSHFENPHGLDEPNHYSTAYDLALFARTAMQYPTFARIVGQKAYTALSRQRTWHNTNRLLWSFEGATGVKTGTTSRAGNCLVAAADREGMSVIAVVLGSADRWADSSRLLEYGFSAFALVELAARGEEVARLPVAGGGRRPARLVAGERLAVVVPVRKVKDVRGVVELAHLSAPVRAGQVVGRVVGYLGDRAFGSVPVLAGDAVPARPWWRWWE